MALTLRIAPGPPPGARPEHQLPTHLSWVAGARPTYGSGERPERLLHTQTKEIEMADKCDATFITDTYETFTCERPDGVHLRHRDNNGTTAIRVPGGALITKKTR